MEYTYPKNKKEYWSVVDSHWEKLYNILAMFLPMRQLRGADDLRLRQDKKIVELFDDAWANAPDNISIHSIPCWNVLCDLCSEAYVLDEENSNDYKN